MSDSERAHAFVRPDVRCFEQVVHGSVSESELAEFGLRPADVCDFSVNTNPLGPSPNVLRAIATADWTRYPGDDEPRLRTALALRDRVAPEQVVLGNGSVELLWLVALAALRPGDRMVVVGPTFGEYARAGRVAGAEVVEVPDLSDASASRLLVVCNPNNPTGHYYDRASIQTLLTDAPSRGVVLDEAYAPFVDERWRSEALLEHGNLAILRSMTKEHGLPGLRLGYVLAAPAFARALEAVRPPWSVNAGALRAGLAALEPEAEAHVARACVVVGQSRKLLVDGFTQLGFQVQQSAANFVLVDVGDGAGFRRALLPHGLVVRDCASFGLPGHVRVACRVPEECMRLLAEVDQLQLSRYRRRF
jgi:histidinol-phosphate aminotransferase